jgi:hypothetical protein
MSGPEDECTPGAGQRAGGAENRNHHPDSASTPCSVDRGDEKGLSDTRAAPDGCGPTGDIDQAIDFLKNWGLPWTLTAIVPDGGKTRTRDVHG